MELPFGVWMVKVRTTGGDGGVGGAIGMPAAKANPSFRPPKNVGDRDADIPAPIRPIVSHF